MWRSRSIKLLEPSTSWLVFATSQLWLLHKVILDDTTVKSIALQSVSTLMSRLEGSRESHSLLWALAQRFESQSSDLMRRRQKPARSKLNPFRSRANRFKMALICYGDGASFTG